MTVHQTLNKHNMEYYTQDYEEDSKAETKCADSDPAKHYIYKAYSQHLQKSIASMMGCPEAGEP